jgi:hypothetical protein
MSKAEFQDGLKGVGLGVGFCGFDQASRQRQTALVDGLVVLAHNMLQKCWVPGMNCVFSYAEASTITFAHICPEFN